MTTLSPADHRDKIRDQLVYELFVEPEAKKINKSKCGLSKRAKFLAKPENLKSKNEPSNEMPPMKRSGR